MPSPDQQAQAHGIPSRLADMFKPNEFNLAMEFAALREEIVALRAELKPVSSLIVTGQQVVAEFKQLRQLAA